MDDISLWTALTEDCLCTLKICGFSGLASGFCFTKEMQLVRLKPRRCPRVFSVQTSSSRPSAHLPDRGCLRKLKRSRWLTDFLVLKSRSERRWKKAMARVFRRLYKNRSGEVTGFAWCVEYWVGKKRVSRTFGKNKKQADLCASEIERKK